MHLNQIVISTERERTRGRLDYVMGAVLNYAFWEGKEMNNTCENLIK